MHFDAFVDAIRDDSVALAAAARRGLEPPVPSCPGWIVRDVVAHTGVVHRHKEQILRERWTAEMPEPTDAPASDLVEWFEDGAAQLLTALAATPPDTPIATWSDEDTSAGFWYRRMAHETAVHRVDAESGHGLAAPVGAYLAADGVDEVLDLFMGGAPPWGEVKQGSRVVRVETTDVPRSWSLSELTWSGVSPSGNRYSDESGFSIVGGEALPTAVISGSASDVLLYIWGRGPVDRLVIEGDGWAPAWLRQIAAESTG